MHTYTDKRVTGRYTTTKTMNGLARDTYNKLMNANNYEMSLYILYCIYKAELWINHLLTCSYVD